MNRLTELCSFVNVVRRFDSVLLIIIENKSMFETSSRSELPPQFGF